MKKILIVDDSAVVRKSASLLLKKMGYETLLAQNGKEALDVFSIENENLFAILLDVIMPVMGGEKALPLLKQINSKIPIIICAGYVPDDIMHELNQEGFHAFLPKPFTGKALKTILKAI